MSSQALIQDRLEDLKFSLEMQQANLRPLAGPDQMVRSQLTADPKVFETYFQSVSDHDLTAGEVSRWFLSSTDSGLKKKFLHRLQKIIDQVNHFSPKSTT